MVSACVRVRMLAVHIWVYVVRVLALLHTTAAVNCYAGEFKSEYAENCQPCPPGTVSRCLGSTRCEACAFGLVANTQKTECVFSSTALNIENIELQYENSVLCLDVNNGPESFRVSFGSQQQHDYTQQDIQFDVVHDSCTVTSSPASPANNKNNKNNKMISQLSNLLLDECTSGTTTDHLRLCTRIEKLRAKHLELNVREFRVIDNQYFFGNSIWKAAAWTVDRDCDDLHYLDDRSISPQDWKCNPCPAHASCQGATNFDDLRPLFGHRRLDLVDACENISECGDHRVEKFESCLYPPACLGAQNPDFHSVYPEDSNASHGELCNVRLGYKNSSRGCRKCLPKYYSNNNVLCTQCPSMAWNIITTIFALGVFILVLFFFLSKSLSDSERLSTKDDVTYSNLAQSMEKIMIAHAQILGLMAGFPLRWPAWVRQFFWIFALFSNPAAYLFNPACFGVDDTNRSLFMLKQTFVLSLPFLLVIPLTLFWFGVSKCSDRSIRAPKTNTPTQVAALSALPVGARFMCVSERGVAYRNTPNRFDRFEAVRGPESGQIMVALEYDAKLQPNWMKVALHDGMEKWLPLIMFERIDDRNNNTNINEKKVPVGADKDESGEQKHSKAKTSVSATVFGGATHLKREELKGLFHIAASRNGQTISRNQFIKLVLQHGDVLGHDWRPRDVKQIFDQRKSGFSFAKRSHYHEHGLPLDGFIAGVVNHLHARHEMNMKLQRAHGCVDMVEHHDGSTKGSEKITHLDKWINTFISLMYMLYPTLCTATFSLVGCTSVGEFNEYIQGDMEFQCWKEGHVVFVVLLFVPAFLVFVVGLPVASLVMLRRNQHLLHINRRVKFQLSILCAGYRPSFEFWESVVSLRKGLVVGISIFVLQAGPKLQTLAAQVLMGLLLVLQTSYQPYVKVATRHDPLNTGEFFGLTAAFCTLTGGMYLHHYGDSSSGSFKITVSVLVIFINVVFFVLAIRWYTVVYLVDLEMTLDRDKKKNIVNSYLAYCLQRCLPDWREESHTDDIENAGLHRRRIAQLMSVDRLMRINGFAKRWVKRTRLSLERKKVDAIERNSELMAEKFQKKLRKLSIGAHDRLELKLKMRKSKMKE